MITLTATQLPRVINCNGSLQMKRVNEEDDPTARDEGNAAHWAALQTFKGASASDLIGRAAFNGFIITSEMMRYVNEYVSALDCGEMEVDTSFNGPTFGIHGRADHIKYNPHTLTLVVDDFKYGFRIVDPVRNWTMISHAIGYMIRNQLIANTIIFRIHQPRPHHPDGKLREWTITGATLDHLNQIMIHALSNLNNSLNTGPHCHRCPSLGICPAYREAGYNAIDAQGIAFDDDIDNEVLAFEIDTLRQASNVIENRLKAIEELARYRLQNGQILQDYGLDQQYGNRTWKKGFNGEGLSRITGIDCTERKSVTPAEAIRRGVPDVVVNALSERPMTGLKLVRASADARARKLLKQ